MLDDVQGFAQKKVLRSIGRVASLEFQLRECLGGTADQYVLLDELLETTINSAEREATHPVVSEKWTRESQKVLLDFSRKVSKLFDEIAWQDPGVSLEEIIHSHAMRQIRATAQDCLRHFDVEFTMEQLLSD